MNDVDGEAIAGILTAIAPSHRKGIPSKETTELMTTSERCWTCFRPSRMCFCDSLKPIEHRTSVLILQHRRERSHPFNTARIVHESLNRCELMVGYNHELADRFDAAVLHPSVGVLYPSDDAVLLDELPIEQRPEQLVILDGTWHQAKTLYRDIPRLQSMPRYRLAPSSPGRYRIRREPNEHALSTLEATVAALQALEPENTDLHQLIKTFDRMIGEQIDQHAAPPLNWRRNERRRRGSANIPRVLAGDLDRVVVAYGERDLAGPVPVYWTAQRLGTGESFRCAIRSDCFDDDHFMSYLNLDELTIRSAVDMDEFRRLWRAFLRPSDQLAIYHSGTSRLLENVDAAFAPVTILKSVNVSAELNRDTVRIADAGEASVAMAVETSRASVRLQTAIEYVHQLNSLCREDEEGPE